MAKFRVGDIINITREYAKLRKKRMGSRYIPNPNALVLEVSDKYILYTPMSGVSKPITIDTVDNKCEKLRHIDLRLLPIFYNIAGTDLATYISN